MFNLKSSLIKSPSVAFQFRFSTHADDLWPVLVSSSTQTGLSFVRIIDTALHLSFNELVHAGTLDVAITARNIGLGIGSAAAPLLLGAELGTGSRPTLLLRFSTAIQAASTGQAVTLGSSATAAEVSTAGASYAGSRMLVPVDSLIVPNASRWNVTVPAAALLSAWGVAPLEASLSATVALPVVNATDSPSAMRTSLDETMCTSAAGTLPDVELHMSGLAPATNNVYVGSFQFCFFQKCKAWKLKKHL